MTLRIIDEAAEEIAESEEYYHEGGESLGTRFRTSISRCLDAIERNPKTYPRVDEPLKDREIRHRSVDSFPFRVIYEILADEIVILAVVHHSRGPGYWHRREP